MVQCVEACCGVLKCVAVHKDGQPCFDWLVAFIWNVLQCVAVCCGVLQCVAVCCSVLRCVEVCCSVLRCVAVYCSVLHRELEDKARQNENDQPLLVLACRPDL